MSRSQFNLPVYTFIGGKVTDTGPFVSGDNTAEELLNFDLERASGGISKRRPIDVEEDYAVAASLTEDIASSGIGFYLWENVVGRNYRSFRVVQLNNILYFFDDTADVPSATPMGQVDFSDYLITNSLYTDSVGMTAAKGKLVVTGSSVEPFYVDYDEDTGAFSTTMIDIQMRDFRGVEEDINPDTGAQLQDNERIMDPHPLTKQHHYNLRNQGWPYKFGTRFPQAAIIKDPLLPMKKSRKLPWPSNVDKINMFLIETASEDQPGFLGCFDPLGLYMNKKGQKALENLPVTRGHIKFNAFMRDRQAALIKEASEEGPARQRRWEGYIPGLNDLAEDYNLRSRPTVARFYSGRVFYSGVTDKVAEGSVFFSRHLRTEKDLGVCYQAADPTAPEINQLVKSDGGVIELDNAGRILGLEETTGHLVVVGTGGAWTIAGGADMGFDAETYVVSKVTDQGAVSKKSITSFGAGVVYASDSTIIMLTPNKLGGLDATDLLVDRRSQEYLAIAKPLREQMVSVYDKTYNRIYFMFQSGDTDQTYKLDTFWIYDIIANAFYDYEIQGDATSPFVVGAILGSGITTDTQLAEVVDTTGALVVDTTNEQVVVSQSIYTSSNIGLVFLLAIPNGANHDITFGEVNVDQLNDWYRWNGTGYGYEAIAETSWDINIGIASTGGAIRMADRRKQALRLVMHFKQHETELTNLGDGMTFVEPGSCKVAVRWDFTGKVANHAHRWQEEFEAYRYTQNYIHESIDVADAVGTFDYPYSVLTTKSRVRGRGRACSLRFRVPEANYCHIYGWELAQLVGSR